MKGVSSYMKREEGTRVRGVLCEEGGGKSERARERGRCEYLNIVRAFLSEIAVRSPPWVTKRRGSRWSVGQRENRKKGKQEADLGDLFRRSAAKRRAYT